VDDHEGAASSWRPIPWWRRGLAFLLDIVIFAPPIAFFCVAGSFDTETTHHSVSSLYVLAAACAGALPACEILFAGSPGLRILRGRIFRVDGARASRGRLALRVLLKYAPLALPWVCFGGIVLLDQLGGRRNMILFAAVIALIAVAAGFIVLRVTRSSLRRRQLPASWFDDYADTRVFVRRSVKPEN